MSKKKRLDSPWFSLIFSFTAALLTGCGAGPLNHAAPVAEATPAAVLEGTTFGGQQPVAGATLQLYAASLSSYGASATPLLTGTPIKTNSSGNFTINNYTCPTPDAPVYLVATGGNSGFATTNPNLALMVALGSCNALANYNSFIQMNEVTTVGAVYALAPFMTGLGNLGTDQGNVAGLSLAFADVTALVNNATGAAGGPSLPSGATLPTNEINTLADILSACINSTGGTASDGSQCGKLFAAATPAAGGTAPTDTITAALDIVQHPGQSVPALYELLPSKPPFEPTLTSAPNDWTLSVTYTSGGFVSPSAVAIDAGGNVWITNRSGNTVTELTHAGAVASTSSQSLSSPSAVAIDSTGAPWITDASTSTLTHLTMTGGASATAMGGGLNVPSAIAIDPEGNLWVANGGSNVVSEFTGAGTPVSGAGYAGTGINKPLGIAISAH